MRLQPQKTMSRIDSLPILTRRHQLSPPAPLSFPGWMLGDRVMRRQAWMGQHSDRVEARRRQEPRMRAVKRGVVLPDRRHPQLLDLRFLHALRLGATILKPDLHL